MNGTVESRKEYALVLVSLNLAFRINPIWNTNAVIRQSSVVWTPYPVRGVRNMSPPHPCES